MGNTKDVQVLRNLAGKVSEISAKPIQDEKRDLWRKNNSLIKIRPLIFLQIGNWDAMGTEVINDRLECIDPLFREIEFKLRYAIFKDEFGDDEIIEPWITVDPVFSSSGWGFDSHNLMPDYKGGAHKLIACIKEIDDIKHLKVPKHEIDQIKTNERYHLVKEAISAIIQVDHSKGTAYMNWGGDISTWFAQLVGMEEMMYYVYDRPEWIHKILAFMRDGILKAQQEAEDAGDLTLTCHANQAMTYSKELPDPKANSESVKRNMLWGFFAAQEFVLMSPEMHEEFMLNYQIPIMKNFGFTAYGCCEDLTRKIDILRKVPNLRRISITPWANVGKCAEQIQRDYVMSWRPNPSSTICNDWDPSLIRKVVKEAMDASKGCNVDITLKDVQTVKGEIWRFKEWVKIVRDISDNY